MFSYYKQSSKTFIFGGFVSIRYEEKSIVLWHGDFPPGTRHLLPPQGCKSTMRCLNPAGRRFQAQKGILRWRMVGDFNPSTKVEKQEKGPANYSFQYSQGAIGSLRLRWLWAVYRYTLNHAPWGINLPRIIDESTYFCLWINEFILIPSFLPKN